MLLVVAGVHQLYRDAMATLTGYYTLGGTRWMLMQLLDYDDEEQEKDSSCKCYNIAIINFTFARIKAWLRCWYRQMWKPELDGCVGNGDGGGWLRDKRGKLFELGSHVPLLCYSLTLYSTPPQEYSFCVSQ